ncbi:unnamed protein product [Schistosoma mattheei]|uniref:Uncharacterized protein n=1 Tax=Schistosoma mattheei TaxID=31246 RepID=A0A183P054_9TREM|nr:unnamed protein product [Schistosoma mattheei]
MILTFCLTFNLVYCFLYFLIKSKDMIKMFLLNLFNFSFFLTK